VPFVAEQTWVMESYFNQATQSNFYYESDNWRKGLDPGFGPGVVQGYTARFYAPDVCSIPHSNILTHPQTLSYLTFTAPDGTQYNLYSAGGRANFAPCAQGGFSRGRVFTTADGSAATFISDADVIDYPFPNYPTEFTVSGDLLLRDGTRYHVINGQVREVRDRNGNKLTVDPDANGRVHTITDSLGRVVTINYGVQEGGQYGTCTQLIFSGFGGAQRVVRLTQTNLGSALRAGYSLQPHGADATPYDPTVTSSVWLPDGRRYRLYYNDMGELARVEAPTGGAVEYDHEGGLQGGDPEGTFEGQPDNAGGHYLHIYRRLVERRLYPDGGTGSAWVAKMTIS
jgi:YD repeat-containing protein